ncbi:hypothetical protein [Clavibacter tessellarius]
MRSASTTAPPVTVVAAWRWRRIQSRIIAAAPRTSRSTAGRRCRRA